MDKVFVSASAFVVVGVGIVLFTLFAMLMREPVSKVTADGKLIIEDRTITAFEADGSRCVMVTSGVHSTALSCDHTFALRQGESK